MQTPCHITVDPDGYTPLAVDIQRGGASVLALSRQNGNTRDAVALPATITVPTVFWLTDGAGLTVSMKVDDQEIGADGAAPQSVTVPSSGGVAVRPQADPLKAAGDAAAAGGSGTSSTSMSTTKMTVLEAPIFTVVAGTDLAHISFTGGTITDGEDYWGVTGSALPLGATVNADGDPVLPDEDSIYDLTLQVTMSCAVADAGKWTGLRVAGDLTGTHTCWSKIAANGSAYMSLDWSDAVMLGDGPTAPVAAIYGTYLTVDAPTTYLPRLIIRKR